MPTAGTPYVADLLPDSRLAWIERCGHLPMIERPDVYHNLLQGFLDICDSSSVSAIAS
jgi:pimeloyl-ACP methyl ester carboxylesterase